MTNGSKKKISERPLLLFLSTFMGLAVFLTILAMFDGKDILFAVGTYFLYGGIIVVIIGFAFLNKGSRWDGYSQSEYIRNPEYFKQVRVQERPFERIVWAVILTGISIAAIGYFLNRLLVG
jgi:hypothetical protein